ATGRVFIYQRDLGGPDNWGFRTLVYESPPDEQSAFGWGIAIDGDLLAVSTPPSGLGGTYGTWLYGRNQGGQDNWGLIKRIWPEGGSPALANDTLLLGEYPYPTNGSIGAVHVFQRNLGGTDNWGFAKTVRASDFAANDSFG